MKHYVTQARFYLQNLDDYHLVSRLHKDLPLIRACSSLSPSSGVRDFHHPCWNLSFLLQLDQICYSLGSFTLTSLRSTSILHCSTSYHRLDWTSSSIMYRVIKYYLRWCSIWMSLLGWPESFRRLYRKSSRHYSLFNLLFGSWCPMIRLDCLVKYSDGRLCFLLSILSRRSPFLYVVL